METGISPDYERGVTFEKVWAQTQEINQQMKETDLRFKETDRRFKETDRRLKETERLVKENSRQIGGLHNSFGELAEHLVAPGIADRFNELGYHFDSIATRGATIYGKQRKIRAEIDILLENGDCIIAVEVKSKVTPGDAEHHIRRLEILRELKRHDQRKIYGAIAGAVFPREAKEAALASGLYVLGQSGDTMTMELPDGFIPQEW